MDIPHAHCLIEPLLQTLEESIWHQFLPAVMGRQGITDLERELLALPACHDSLGVRIPTRNTNNQFKDCTEVIAPLVKLISQWNPNYPKPLQQEQRQLKSALCTRNRREITKESKLLKPKLSGAGQRAMKQPSEKGASASHPHVQTWLQPSQTGIQRCPLP